MDRTLKTKEEMIHYLGLTKDTYEKDGLSSTLDTAMELQKKYDLNQYGLCLDGDFSSIPSVLEDLKDNEELVALERTNGIVVYQKKEKENTRNTENEDLSEGYCCRGKSR